MEQGTQEAIPFATAATLPAQPCSVCGVLPPVGQSFDTPDASRPICTLCQTRRRERRTIWIIVLLAACLTFELIRCARDPRDHWLFINLMLVGLLAPISVALHEVGHSLGAWLTGCQVFAIRLGKGPRLMHFKVGGIDLRVGALLMGGSVTVAPSSPAWIRPRMAFMVFMGPAVNLALLALGIWMIAPADHSLMQPWWTGFAPWHALIYANLVTALASLLPVPRLSATQGPSDGNLIVHYLFGPRKRLEARCFDRVLLEADRLQLADRCEDSAALLEAALQQQGVERDDRLRLQTMLAVVRLKQFRYVEGIDLFTDALNVVGPSPEYQEFRGRTFNNLAWGHLMMSFDDAPAHLADADRCSLSAYAMLPEMPATRSTRGSVLIEKGDLEQGIALLRSAMENAERDESKACCAAFIAIGERRSGRVDEADRMLAKARRLDPRCEVLPHAEKTFSA